MFALWKHHIWSLFVNSFNTHICDLNVNIIKVHFIYIDNHSGFYINNGILMLLLFTIIIKLLLVYPRFYAHFVLLCEALKNDWND